MQILGPVGRINAMPCTNGGGESQAVQVPPSACHCSTMLWRRKSITEMIVSLSTASVHPPASRIGCVRERTLHDAGGEDLRQNLRLRGSALGVVYHVQR